MEPTSTIKPFDPFTWGVPPLVAFSLMPFVVWWQVADTLVGNMQRISVEHGFDLASTIALQALGKPFSEALPTHSPRPTSR